MQVLISDDHMAITMIACQLAKQAFDDPTVRVAHGVDALFEELNQHPVDLLVLDLTMPGTVKRIELLRAVRRWSPVPRILIYSTDASPCLIAAALECGATGFVQKGAPLTSLLHGMMAAAKGECYLDPCIEDAGSAHPWRRLTPAERDVLIALVAGRTVKRIAADSRRAYATVATLRSHGMQKLGLRANEELSAYFRRHGLLFELDARYADPVSRPQERSNVIDLRSAELSAADIETIDVIALMLLGTDEGSQQLEVTTRPWQDLLVEYGPDGSSSAAFRFPVMRWIRGDSSWLLVDQGRVRIKIAVKILAAAMPQTRRPRARYLR